MTKFLAPLCAVLALGLVTSGCGGGDDNGGGGGGGGAKTSEKAPANAGGGATAKTADVSMKSIKFNPATVSVPVGGTVKWTNDEGVGHDVTGSGFKSGSPGGMSQGQSFSHTFKKAGTYKYVCTIHKASGMTGTVTVK